MMQYLLTPEEYGELKRKADAYDEMNRIPAQEPEAPPMTDAEFWKAWTENFKADVLKAPSYIATKELWSVANHDRQGLKESDPAAYADLYKWFTAELAKKHKEAAE